MGGLEVPSPSDKGGPRQPLPMPRAGPDLHERSSLSPVLTEFDSFWFTCLKKAQIRNLWFLFFRLAHISLAGSVGVLVAGAYPSCRRVKPGTSANSSQGPVWAFGGFAPLLKGTSEVLWRCPGSSPATSTKLQTFITFIYYSSALE